MREHVAGFFIIFGALFALLAALGLLRLPDFYSRLQASTKAQTLGLMAILIGFAIHFGDVANVAKAFLVLVFVFITAPVAGHMIVRAAYLLGVPLWENTRTDELEGKYDIENKTCAGWRPVRPSRHEDV